MVSSGQLYTYFHLLHHILTNCMAGAQIHEEQAAARLPKDFSGV